MADLGIIEPHPFSGKWHWPLAQMQEGDCFWVRHSQRDPEKLRRMVSVRAAQLGGRSFSFEKHNFERPGLMKITRGKRVEKARLEEHLMWPGLEALLQEQYKLDASVIPWEHIDEGAATIIGRAPRVNADHRWAVSADIGDNRYVVELKDDCVVAYRCEPGETLQSWKDDCLAAMMA